MGLLDQQGGILSELVERSKVEGCSGGYRCGHGGDDEVRMDDCSYALSYSMLGADLDDA